jgi:hypothetical protein
MQLTPEEYKETALIIEYEDLVRNPHIHRGNIVRITVEISQIMSGETSYIGSAAPFNDEQWYIYYNLPQNSPRILVGDSIVFYGQFTGMTELVAILTGLSYFVPTLEAQYHEMQ